MTIPGGTTTLFAALNVATGEVRAGHYRRRRRVEFLDFMNKIVADHPDDSPFLSRGNMRLQTKLPQSVDDVIDLPFTGFRPQNNNHGKFSLSRKSRPA